MAESKATIRQINDPVLIYEQTQKSFQKQGKGVPYSKDFFVSFYKNLEDKNATYSMAAYVQGQPVAAVLIAMDNNKAYLLATGKDQIAPPGSVALLIWNCILEAKKQGKKKFDFEGSMMQNIESFFRSFGGEQTSYHRVFRTNNKWTQLLLTAFNRI